MDKIHVSQKVAPLVGSCEIGSKSTSSVNMWEFLDDLGDDVFSMNVCILHLVTKTITPALMSTELRMLSVFWETN